MSNAITAAANTMGNMALNSVFLVMNETVPGKIASVLFLVASCVVSFFFVYYLVPETKDKSNEECVRLFKGGSPSYVNKINPEEDSEQVQLTTPYLK